MEDQKTPGPDLGGAAPGRALQNWVSQPEQGMCGEGWTFLLITAARGRCLVGGGQGCCPNSHST